MPERPRPDMDRVRDFLREHDEHADEDDTPPPEEPADGEPEDEDGG